MLMTGPNANLNLAWESLEGMINGVSAIDMTQMNLRDLQEAEAFILSYGFDFQHPADREELYAIQMEAISFIERRFLDFDDPSVWADGAMPLILQRGLPKAFKKNYDARHILLEASNKTGVEQLWACAVLKVMHTLCHINNAVLYQYFETARHQILSRYYKAIRHTENGEILFGEGGDFGLSLVGFEIKDEKSRDSMLLKLLCKRENVAEEIFDMVGVRLITHTPVEAILAMELLREHKIVVFPNLMPSRSRNSLIDMAAFKDQYQSILDTYTNGQHNFTETLELIAEIQARPNQGIFNPHNASTLADYRSIHLTERQLIRLKNPESADKEIRFFFPYEIQIVDAANYIQSLSGSSAHALYKRNQIIQARQRVLGPLITGKTGQDKKTRLSAVPVVPV